MVLIYVSKRTLLGVWRLAVLATILQILAACLQALSQWQQDTPQLPVADAQTLANWRSGSGLQIANFQQRCCDNNMDSPSLAGIKVPH
ncbi:hypothetical protein A5320_18305 [Rheinheimera sp. SA_1]|nr:hypothetical protein A5320_18305 [Rheinheimera sp. SA_1]